MSINHEKSLCLNFDESASKDAEIKRLLAENARLTVQLRAAQDVIHMMAKYNRKAQYESETDALTGLPNNRAMMRTLQGMTAQQAESDSPAAILAIDMNNFKTINDTYGHQAGDDALKIMASVLTSQTRGNDFAARRSGDEFIVILHGCSEHNAALKIAEIHTVLAARPLVIHETAIPVSCSIGLHMLNPALSAHDNLHEADQAMYHHKKNTKKPVPPAQTPAFA